jgi:hypothetical protein
MALPVEVERLELLVVDRMVLVVHTKLSFSACFLYSRIFSRHAFSTAGFLACFLYSGTGAAELHVYTSSHSRDTASDPWMGRMRSSFSYTIEEDEMDCVASTLCRGVVMLDLVLGRDRDWTPTATVYRVEWSTEWNSRRTLQESNQTQLGHQVVNILLQNTSIATKSCSA